MTSNDTDSSAEMMSAYLDAEIDSAEATAFENMLADSPDAREELADLRKVLSLVGNLPDVPAPEDFLEKLNRKIRRKQLLAPNPLAKLALFVVPLQVLSILVILAVTTIYMMAELEHEPTNIERDPSAVPQTPEAEPGSDPGVDPGADPGR